MTRAASANSLRVTWEAPPAGQQNGEIIGYKVMYAKDGEASMHVINVENAQQRSVIIDDLLTYTRYRLRVLAYTSVGEGPASPTEVTLTDEDGKTSDRVPSSIVHLQLSVSFKLLLFPRFFLCTVILPEFTFRTIDLRKC